MVLTVEIDKLTELSNRLYEDNTVCREKYTKLKESFINNSLAKNNITELEDIKDLKDV